MENIIIHISDLHVTQLRCKDGKLMREVDSFLTTDLDSASSDLFISSFTDIIKKDFTNKKFSLLVTGDIADSAEEKEYESAIKFFSRILEELSISEKNIMILPGDHDVHRRSIENALVERYTDKAYLENEIKFANFSSFYKEIKKVEFPFGKVIIDYLILEDKIVLLGINSNHKIDQYGGEGYIIVERFKNEIKVLKEELNDDSLQYVACWHHNLSAAHENKAAGQWNFENRKQLLAELQNQNIKLILCGNEHTLNNRPVYDGAIWSSDCGTLTTKKHQATFKVYPVEIDKGIRLHNKMYSLQKTNDNERGYFWNPLDNENAKQTYSFILYTPNNQEISESLELPQAALNDQGNSGTIALIGNNKGELANESEKVAELVAPIYYDNLKFSDKLYNIIREKKLFHSGHFHWSDTSRAHNWIDVSKLLEDHEDLYFVQTAILDVIDQFSLAFECGLIIGLGYEGNIISSKASIKYNIPYTSLPYSYRYKDHHDYEKKLNFENTEGNIKKVIIISDVVNDGRTIRKLIDKREPEFFKKVEKIIVVSLFYTGQQDIDIGILNYDKLPKGYDSDNDHRVNNIEFYTVKSLRIEKCPYGKSYKEDCFIYRDELSCVHLFYEPETS